MTNNVYSFNTPTGYSLRILYPSESGYGDLPAIVLSCWIAVVVVFSLLCVRRIKIAWLVIHRVRRPCPSSSTTRIMLCVLVRPVIYEYLHIKCTPNSHSATATVRLSLNRCTNTRSTLPIRALVSPGAGGHCSTSVVAI